MSIPPAVPMLMMMRTTLKMTPTKTMITWQMMILLQLFVVGTVEVITTTGVEAFQMPSLLSMEALKRSSTSAATAAAPPPPLSPDVKRNTAVAAVNHKKNGHFYNKYNMLPTFAIPNSNTNKKKSITTPTAAATTTTKPMDSTTTVTSITKEDFGFWTHITHKTRTEPSSSSAAVAQSSWSWPFSWLPGQGGDAAAVAAVDDSSDGSSSFIDLGNLIPSSLSRFPYFSFPSLAATAAAVRTKHMIVLDQWRITKNGGISGIVRNHPTLMDGSRIRTSTLVPTSPSSSSLQTNMMIQTMSGSKYLLGGPAIVVPLGGAVTGEVAVPPTNNKNWLSSAITATTAVTIATALLTSSLSSTIQLPSSPVKVPTTSVLVNDVLHSSFSTSWNHNDATTISTTSSSITSTNSPVSITSMIVRQFLQQHQPSPSSLSSPQQQDPILSMSSNLNNKDQKAETLSKEMDEVSVSTTMNRNNNNPTSSSSSLTVETIVPYLQALTGGIVAGASTGIVYRSLKMMNQHEIINQLTMNPFQSLFNTTTTAAATTSNMFTQSVHSWTTDNIWDRIVLMTNFSKPYHDDNNYPNANWGPSLLMAMIQNTTNPIMGTVLTMTTSSSVSNPVLEMWSKLQEVITVGKLRLQEDDHTNTKETFVGGTNDIMIDLWKLFLVRTQQQVYGLNNNHHEYYNDLMKNSNGNINNNNPELQTNATYA